ncbi:hypothetical protein SAMD00019534_062450 [Acytostelium subglobosum LB1]|uniref:hypothetical protein n=1 Tax=Acytostelium subglobosum LB1 TaxID=1410327 RepID=UPI000644C2E3|nr:hypothetical protein SAMD00019534_062450 [Acytostelium subglobosum LB1]GAM23070.1 hypothetical protein SAMD00019534_062450 [Acytostelium subglobosum LB1]|eukprot:XP_012754297.1 hypothetical protein SAMD00019534_062450 [Acytostelium subglobosum LB1]
MYYGVVNIYRSSSSSINSSSNRMFDPTPTESPSPTPIPVTGGFHFSYILGHKNLMPKTIFHAIIALAMLVRSIFFFVQPSIPNDALIVIIWYNISTILLFLAYGCLLLFWIELYTRFSKPYMTSRDFWRKWMPFIAGFNALLVALTVTWILVLALWAKSNKDRLNITEQISEGFVSALFLLAGLGFFIFGFLLFWSFKRLGTFAGDTMGPKTPMLMSQQSSAPPEAIRAAVVGTVCTICFCIRSSVMMYSIREAAVDPSVATTGNFQFTWGFELVYFFVTEILPTMMMLFRMRKMKRRKTVDINRFPSNQAAIFVHSSNNSQSSESSNHDDSSHSSHDSESPLDQREHFSTN